MNTQLSIILVLGLLFLSIPGVCSADNAVPVPMPMVVEEELKSPEIYDSSIEFTRLQVKPGYSDMQLKPGSGDKITVTVTNKDNKTVTVTPFVARQSYGEYLFEENWITITPASADIAPDSKKEFTIEVNIPADADTGHYGTQVAFTNDMIPTLYPTPYPQYINNMQLSVNVWTPPKVQILTPYISSRVETGQEYDFEIKLKNIATRDIPIDPNMADDNMYDIKYRSGPFSMMSQAFEDDAITITAPSVVKAGETAIVNVHLKVPDDAKGSYSGAIVLNIDDSSIQELEGQVQMNFIVWTQPATPYEKSFSSRIDAPITIELNSQQYSFELWIGAGTNTGNDELPSFVTTLINPSGEEVELTLIKTTYSGSVNLGMSDFPPWEMDGEGIYQEVQTGYSEIFTAPGAVGDWILKVLPSNVETFSYSITVGSPE